MTMGQYLQMDSRPVSSQLTGWLDTCMRIQVANWVTTYVHACMHT